MSKMPSQNRSRGARTPGGETDSPALKTIVPLLARLKTARFRLYFRAGGKIFLPKYKGATFRGVFGTVFKEVAAQKGLSRAYVEIFETPNDGRFPDYSSKYAPKPFVLEAPVTAKRRYREGEIFYVDLILVGRAIRMAPELIYIFDEAGKTNGIGKGRQNGFGRFRLLKAALLIDRSEVLYYQDQNIHLDISRLEHSAPWPETPTDELLLIHFITPTHIQYNSAVVEKRAASLTFEALVNSLYRRLFYLFGFHQQMPDHSLQKLEILETPPMEIVEKKLSWEHVRYYSNRQQKKVPLGGFRGTLMVRGAWQPYLPLLKLGEKVHVGNATTFGFGKYRISMDDSF